MSFLKVLNVAGGGDTGNPREATLRIEGVIGGYDIFDGSGTTASGFMRQVDALGELDTINLEINSPGGIVSDGVTITNYLVRHPAAVNVTVIGEAASIASVIAQAADPGSLHMATGATMFVHDPLTGLIGDADEFRAVAERLDKIRDSIVSLYRRRTALSTDEVRDLMRGDTTMTAEEAVEWGFADSMDAELKAVACSEDLTAFLEQAKTKTVEAAKGDQETKDKESEIASLREQVAKLAAEKEPADPAEVIAACKDAEFPAMAVAMVDDALPMTEVRARLQTASTIRDICAAAQINPEPLLSHADNPVEALRIAVVDGLAAMDQDIDSELPGGPQPANKPEYNWGQVFEKLNKQRGKTA